MKIWYTLIALLFFFTTERLSAQTATSVIRGQVVDQESQVPLIGVAVEWVNDGSLVGSITDIDGYFRLDGIPAGRQTLRLSYLGYEPLMLPNVLVTTGKEVVLNLSMSETAFAIDEVVVTAKVDKAKTQNEMAAISARSFNLEEVNRYSGGRNDVARLAGNFAGVAVADDSRNDIVIRGNSPTGVLWRLEGIPIPNPNHFSTLGTTGGPVSAINPNLLRSSDFLTSAFPSEYGNALAGVFDLGFRSGNKETHEFTAQLGAFSGVEGMTEGPINRDNRSSYLVSYRHSFVGLANDLGIPVGTNATPNYRDISFKLDFGQSKLGNFSLFGIGGTSDIDFLGDEIDENDLFADPDANSYADSELGILGLRHNLIVGDGAYLRTVVAASTAQSAFQQDNFLAGDQLLRVTENEDRTTTYSVSSFLNKKVNARLTYRTGILAEFYQLNTFVRDRDNRPDLDEDGEPDWVTLRDFDGNFALIQAFAQAKYKLAKDWELNGGLHTQYLDLTDKIVVEPRVAISHTLTENSQLTLGYGLHHQVAPFPVFFFQEEQPDGSFAPTNQDLGFTRSNHLVLGYDRQLTPDWRLKSELYYQWLTNVPVSEAQPTFSILNAGSDFVFPEAGSLVNEGVGLNYGVEVTVEKFFSNNYYALLTASIFDSEYEGSDGVRRNTAFNNGYVVNLLGGREWKIGKDRRNALTFDMKLTTAGGRFYTPVDLEASLATGEEILQDELAFSEQQDPYFRLDLKFGFQLNSANKKLSQQFFIDLQNVTNNDNIFARRFNPQTGQVNEVLQSGFFPDLMYRIQF